MRRKITESDQGTSELPELTEQQRNFVFLLLQGNTASDAYRASYDCSTMQSNSIWVAASRLKSDAKVALWLATARKAGESKAKVTYESHLAELERLRELAIEKGNLGAAVQSENFRGKVAGLYMEKLEVSTADPLDSLAELEKLSPAAAKALRDELGIHETPPTAH